MDTEDKQGGLISQVLGWFTHPNYSNGGILEWFSALVLIFIVSFLWSTVVRGID